MLAVGLVVCVLKAIDLRRGPPIGGFRRRLGHVLVAFDTRRGRPCPPRVDGAAVARLALAGAMAAGAVAAFHATSLLSGAPRYAARWLVVAVGLFAGFECLVAVLRLGAAAFGLEAPPLHDHPERSRSLSEFWARRWNRVISGVLHDLCFEPLARRSAPLALTATFAASAAIHGYAMGVALGLAAGLSWAAFFLLQPPLIGLERALRPRRWPVPAQRLWTAAALALPSPLFLEPVARLIA